MLKTATIIIAAATLTGCVSTLAELRESQPLRTATVAHGSAPELAACTMGGLETGDDTDVLTYRLLTLGGESSVVGSMPRAFMTTVPMIEATFTPTRDGVRVATRGQWGLVAPKIDRAVWPIIERCAGTTLAGR